ncbi:MAG: patatin-like phospholipase family protein [Parvularculaceae bacterium]|nr:patatin-like phospholipase family protein [Parvularculaceae bacterium]
MPEAQESCAGLVLSGGGARGAYQVGVISALAEHCPGPSPFPVITGVSVGAINAIVLAEGADDFQAAAAKLEGLWRGLNSASIFATDLGAMASQLGGWLGAVMFGRFGVSPPKSFLENRPLVRLLQGAVDFSRIQTMINLGALQGLAVTASSYSTGQSVTFFQGAEPDLAWQRSRRFGAMAQIGVDHIMASAALPGVFPAQRIGETWYGDGALRQNMPLSPAIHLGCDRLLMIAARDGTPDTEDVLFQGREHPSLGIIGGQLLDIIFNDNLDADIERLERINKTLATMMPERREKTQMRHVAHQLVRPSQDIREIAGLHANEAPATVRTLLGILGAMRPPWVLPSYLTFEPGYVGALIDLGRRDAEAQMSDLLALIRR